VTAGVTTGVAAGVMAVAATLLVLNLAHRTRLQHAALGYAEAVPVGLLLGLSTAASARPAQLVVTALVAVLGTAAAVVDAHERRLPNVLTATLGVGLLIAIPAAGLLTHNLDRVLRASVAAAVTAAVMLGVKAARPAMIGWGDVKLVPSLTAALAWAGVSTLAHGLVLWIVLLLATTVVWRVARFDASDTVPYGPALVLGTLGALVVT
jgi:hypothetical protein